MMALRAVRVGPIAEYKILLYPRIAELLMIAILLVLHCTSSLLSFFTTLLESNLQIHSDFIT